MAKASQELIDALRETAGRVSTGVRYEWGRMAHCNCGHLIQTVTQRQGAEIAKTVEHHPLEWTEHARDYCPNSGHAVEDLFKALANMGFGREDVIHLENLSDPTVLKHLGSTYLQRNHREDLVRYLYAHAELLENQMDAEEESAPAKEERVTETEPAFV